MLVLILCYSARVSWSMSAFSVLPSTSKSRTSANICTYAWYTMKYLRKYGAHCIHLDIYGDKQASVSTHPITLLPVSRICQNTHTPPPTGAAPTYYARRILTSQTGQTAGATADRAIARTPPPMRCGGGDQGRTNNGSAGPPELRRDTDRRRLFVPSPVHRTDRERTTHIHYTRYRFLFLKNVGRKS